MLISVECFETLRPFYIDSMEVLSLFMWICLIDIVFVGYIYFHKSPQQHQLIFPRIYELKEYQKLEFCSQVLYTEFRDQFEKNILINKTSGLLELFLIIQS